MKSQPVWKVLAPAAMIGFGLLVLIFVSAVSASASGFGPGDLLVALTDGTVQVRSTTDGTLKTTLVPPFQATANGLALDASGNLLVSYWWTADFSNGNTVGKFAPDGSYLGTFGSGYSCQPSGIAVDGSGNVYVGDPQCDGKLLKFNSAGTLVQIFAPVTENTGVRWIDLASDGCTMYYTSAGLDVLRYNVCTSTQLANLNWSPLPLESGADLLGLRITPDGGVIAAATYDARKLDASGNLVGTPYKVVNDNGIAGIWLDKDGTSFWASSFETGTVYKFDIATHAVLLEFSTGLGAKGIIIVPQPTPVPGRMTGGGTFAAVDGTIVSDAFQLRCNAQDPRQSLDINWGNGQRFHLDTVATVTCYDDPAINPGSPSTPFDTMVLTGTGQYNGQSGATISLVFTDAGEPGFNDGVQMVIKDSGGNTVLSVPATTLLTGSQQAHRETGN